MSSPASGSPTDESRWATSVVLGDGTSAFMRPLIPADEEALLAFHHRQSSESVYRRYFSPKPTLTAQELSHFTTVDMVDRVALAVLVHDELVGWSSYERWPGRNEAEAAFMVDDEHHGKGIATLMLEHLAAIARTNGITRFTAEVLSDNRGMLAVFAKAGWPLQRRFESGVVDLDWELATTSEFLDSVERREQRADSRAIARILLPRAVAVIGASDREGSVGHVLWNNVRASVTVPVYPVNPRLDELDGQPCFASVDDVPDDASLAIIAVPARSLGTTIDGCIAKRMRGAVVVTNLDESGTDGLDIGRLVDTSRRNGLRLIGPSSMGVASLHRESALQAALVDVTLPAGGVAISMQSGSLGGSLLRQARDLRLGLSWFVSLGDKSDVSANDLLQFWEDDHHTKVIGLYTESFGNPRKFARIARRVSRSRPIVAVRTGSAAMGSMGGALYQQAGLIEVPTVNAMLDVCRVLESQPIMRGARVAVITNSSSPGTLTSAALEANGLIAVRPATPLTWQAEPGDYERAIAAALMDSEVDGLVVVFAPPVPAFEAAMGPTIHAAAAGATKPVVAVMLGSGDGPVAEGSNVPAFAFPEQAVAALARSYDYGRWLATEAAAEPITVRPVDPQLAAEIIDDALGSRDRVQLEITTAARLLASYGISLAPAETTAAADAVGAAERLGFPVAVKAVRRHRGRSARAGVALDLMTSDDVAAAVATMTEALGDDASRVTVQQMTAPGVDVRIHCKHDERLGVIIEVGYGGVDADLIDDRTSRLAPLSPAAASAMLTETKVGLALASADLDSSPLVDTIVQAAQLCAEHPDIDELDLNPVIVSVEGAIVTDVSVGLLDRPDHEGPLRKLD